MKSLFFGTRGCCGVTATISSESLTYRHCDSLNSRESQALRGINPVSQFDTGIFYTSRFSLALTFILHI